MKLVTNKVLLGIFYLTAMCLWHCSTNVAGGGSESGNPVIVGKVNTVSGDPAENTILGLIPSKYNPAIDEALPDSLLDTTDALGNYQFNYPGSGSYNIEAVNTTYGTRALIQGISVSEDTTFIKDVYLTDVGALKIFLPDTIDTANGYLVILGTTNFKKLSGGLNQSSDGYEITMDSLPGLNDLNLHYSQYSTPEPPAPVSDPFTVLSQDTTLIKAFVFWQNYTQENASLRDNRVNDVLILDSNKLWFGTWAGAALFDGTDWDLRYITDFTGIPSNRVNKIRSDRNGNLWFATDKGAAVYNGLDPHHTDNWKIHTMNLSKLPSNFVADMQVDRQGNMWFGMHDGIGMYDGQLWRFHDRSNSNLVSYKIHEIGIDSVDGRIWFATDNNIATLKDSVWTIYNTSNTTILTDVVVSVAVDKFNNKWFGYDGGVSKFDGSTWTGYTEAHSPILKNRVMEIFVEDEKNIWFGTTNGLTKFNGTEWIDYVGELYQLLENKGVHDIEMDQYGNKWVGTFNNGVIAFGPTVK